MAFVGDGTFGFHAMELDTAVRHNLPYVVIVGNDAGWATERHRQREVYGEDRVVAANLLPTRYDLLAQSLGAHGEYVERPDQLAPALERAFASGKPACLNVNIASVRAPSARLIRANSGCAQSQEVSCRVTCRSASTPSVILSLRRISQTSDALPTWLILSPTCLLLGLHLPGCYFMAS